MTDSFIPVATNLPESVSVPTTTRLTGPCRCGCGQPAPLSNDTDSTSGRARGCPVYLRGHWRRGKRAYTWKGGRTNQGPYRLIHMPRHPRADQSGYVKEHIYIAEQALRKLLPPDAVVHHVDENPSHNHPRNLVICQDAAYHALLHLRLRRYRACGHPDWNQCRYCRQYGPLTEVIRDGNGYTHLSCRRAQYAHKLKGFQKLSKTERSAIARRGAEAFWRLRRGQGQETGI